MMTQKAAWPTYSDWSQVQVGDAVKLPYGTIKLLVRQITFGAASPELGCYINGYWVGVDEHCERAELFEADEYQLECLRTCPTDYSKDRNRTLDMCAMGVAGEGGEVVDMLKKVRFQGHEFDPEHFIKELGDVMYYVAVAAHTVGASLSDVMEANVKKLRKRYPEGFSVERSVNREEGDV